MRAKLLLVVAAGVLVAADKPEDAAKAELKKFTGTWVAMSYTEDGTEIRMEAKGLDGKTLEILPMRDIMLVVDGEKYTYTKRKETVKGTHTLDPGKKPKQIDAVRELKGGKKEEIKGIYELDGDSFKVCFAAPGKDRPTKFSANKGSGNRLIVMKRMK